MFYAIQIGNTRFTCCTTGQQYELAQAAQAIGADYFMTQDSQKRNHAEFSDYDSPATLQAFIFQHLPDEFDHAAAADGKASFDHSAAQDGLNPIIPDEGPTQEESAEMKGRFRDYFKAHGYPFNIATMKDPALQSLADENPNEWAEACQEWEDDPNW